MHGINLHRLLVVPGKVFLALHAGIQNGVQVSVASKAEQNFGASKPSGLHNVNVAIGFTVWTGWYVVVDESVWHPGCNALDIEGFNRRLLGPSIQQITLMRPTVWKNATPVVAPEKSTCVIVYRGAGLQDEIPLRLADVRRLSLPGGHCQSISIRCDGRSLLLPLETSTKSTQRDNRLTSFDSFDGLRLLCWRRLDKDSTADVRYSPVYVHTEYLGSNHARN
jgi:hypothetical protein